MKHYEEIKSEDYKEPRCVLCDPQTGTPAASSSVPLQRITEKLDQYCGRKDFAGAARHLEYWLEEAKYNGDRRGEFSLLNERMGFYRKQENQEKALESAERALRLMRELELESTESGATCLINCGTVYDQFGMPEKALRYFTEAKDIMEEMPRKDPYRLGSLYNNMALALKDAERYGEANDCFRKALAVMEEVENGEPEQAITWMNMADTVALEQGLDAAQPEIEDYLNRAETLLNAENLKKDSYYAFVCEKCAPGFYCYGFSEFGEELERRAAAIYAQQ